VGCRCSSSVATDDVVAHGSAYDDAVTHVTSALDDVLNELVGSVSCPSVVVNDVAAHATTTANGSTYDATTTYGLTLTSNATTTTHGLALTSDDGTNEPVGPVTSLAKHAVPAATSHGLSSSYGSLSLDPGIATDVYSELIPTQSIQMIRTSPNF